MVYVENEVVAKWDEISKVMMFGGEGKNIKDIYKKLMAEGRWEEGEFTE